MPHSTVDRLRLPLTTCHLLPGQIGLNRPSFPPSFPLFSVYCIANYVLPPSMKCVWGRGKGHTMLHFQGVALWTNYSSYSSTLLSPFLPLSLCLSLCHIRIHARLGTLINGIPTVLLWSIVKRVPLLKFYECERERGIEREQERKLLATGTRFK